MNSDAQGNELDRRCGLLLSHLVHEIRNPLASIAAASRLLLKAADRPEMMLAARDALDRQVAQVSRMMQELSDTAQVARGVVRVKTEQYDVSSVVATAVEPVKPVIEQRSARLEFDPPTAPLFVQGDAARTAQSLSLILDAATEGLKPGGTLQVVITQDDGVSIRVQHDGTGFPERALSQLLEFLPPDEEERLSRAGHGFGIAMASALLSLQNGSLAIHSDGVERGTSFLVRLPAGPS